MSDAPSPATMNAARRLLAAEPKSNADAWELACTFWPKADKGELGKIVRLAMILRAPVVPTPPPPVKVTPIADGRVRFIPDNDNEKKPTNGPLSEISEVRDLS